MMRASIHGPTWSHAWLMSAGLLQQGGLIHVGSRQ